MADRMNALTKNDNNYPSSFICLIIVVLYIAAMLHYNGKTQLYIEEPDSYVEAMGERAIQSEPPILMVADQAHKILECIGSLYYLKRLQGFHKELTLEFLQNLQNDSTMVKGISMMVSKEVRAKVI